MYFHLEKKDTKISTKKIKLKKFKFFKLTNNIHHLKRRKFYITGWLKWLAQLLNKNFNVQNCVFFNEILSVYILACALSEHIIIFYIYLTPSLLQAIEKLENSGKSPITKG